MRKINFREPDDPNWRRWVKTCKKKAQRLCEAYQNGEVLEITSYYDKQKDVFADLVGPFRGKCAYCERYVFRGQHGGELDHYRPKRGTLSENWKPVARTQDGAVKVHPGYYWLCYDWTNLLLTCIECNQVVKGRLRGKGSRFPVFENRAWAPGEERWEGPGLINPCSDDPKDHLKFNRSTGWLEPKSEMGATTIRVLGLNDEPLPYERLDAYKDVRARIEAIIKESAGDTQARLQELYAAKTRSFTSVVRLAFRDQEREELRRQREGAK